MKGPAPEAGADTVVDGGTNQTSSRGPRRHRRDRSRGAVLIEAAILLPLLVLLTFGAVEYGLIFRDDLKITTAARSGARIGTADKTSDGSAVNPTTTSRSSSAEFHLSRL
jgi:Flp pilus assembly protein TadG